MRMLIFVDKIARMDELGVALPQALRLVGAMPDTERKLAMNMFEQDENGVLIATQTFVSGWHAPTNTVVLFAGDVSYWGQAMIRQALARPRP